MHGWWPIKLISDQLWELIVDYLNSRFSIASWRLIVHQISHQVNCQLLAAWPDNWRLNVADLLPETWCLQFYCFDHLAGQNAAVPALTWASSHGDQALLINIDQQFTLCSISWRCEMEYRRFRIHGHCDSIRCQGDVHSQCMVGKIRVATANQGHCQPIGIGIK